MSLPVAILAGGLATRLSPVTEKVPKSLIEIAGRPFVTYQVELLRRNGLIEVVFCVGNLGDILEEFLGDGSRFGVSIHYSYDGPTLLGTGGALRKALPLLRESFFVLYGDSYLECDYAAVEKAFLKAGSLGLMTVMQNGGKWDRSNVTFRNGQIIQYDKQNPSPNMQYIDYGLGALKAAALDSYPPSVNFDLETVYKNLISQGQLAAFEVTQRFYEIGSPQGILDLEEHLRRLPHEKEKNI
jgi:NDP-sugar pyrophosphorylase family protein